MPSSNQTKKKTCQAILFLISPIIQAKTESQTHNLCKSLATPAWQTREWPHYFMCFGIIFRFTSYKSILCMIFSKSEFIAEFDKAFSRHRFSIDLFLPPSIPEHFFAWSHESIFLGHPGNELIYHNEKFHSFWKSGNELTNSSCGSVGSYLNLRGNKSAMSSLHLNLSNNALISGSGLKSLVEPLGNNYINLMHLNLSF